MFTWNWNLPLFTIRARIKKAAKLTVKKLNNRMLGQQLLRMRFGAQPSGVGPQWPHPAARKPLHSCFYLFSSMFLFLLYIVTHAQLMLLDFVTARTLWRFLSAWWSRYFFSLQTAKWFKCISVHLNVVFFLWDFLLFSFAKLLLHLAPFMHWQASEGSAKRRNMREIS